MWICHGPLDVTGAEAHFRLMDQVIGHPAVPRGNLAFRLSSYAATIILLAGTTLVGLLVAPYWGSQPVALGFIVPVLFAATTCGLRPALATAIAATLAFNYFFTEPYRTLFIHSPADLVTVVVLFLVALVVSRLAASMREQRRRAEMHAARNATIAGFARRLLSCTGETEIAQVAVGELSQLFEAHCAFLVGSANPDVLASAPSSVALAPSDCAACVHTFATGEPTGRGVGRAGLADWQFHPVAASEAILAVIGMAREDGVPAVAEGQRLLLTNLLDQLALALERARLENDARDTAALRERDRLRSALLTSIGVDVKPRLHTIASAARDLRRLGVSEQGIVALIASETALLTRYVDNLVLLEPGSEIAPVAIGPLAIDFHHRRVTRDGNAVRLTPKEYAVLAELAKHTGRVLTHAHLLRAVWGPAQEQQIDYLRVAIRSLRQKLEFDPARPQLIVNEPAVGYRLVAA